MHVPFNRKTGMEWEAEQVTNDAIDVGSLNYTPEESKKAERSTMSVDPLVVKAI